MNETARALPGLILIYFIVVAVLTILVMLFHTAHLFIAGYIAWKWGYNNCRWTKYHRLNGILAFIVVSIATTLVTAGLGYGLRYIVALNSEFLYDQEFISYGIDKISQISPLFGKYIFDYINYQHSDLLFDLLQGFSVCAVLINFTLLAITVILFCLYHISMSLVWLFEWLFEKR